MFKNKTFQIALLIALVGIIVYTFLNTESASLLQTEYAKQLIEKRQEKDKFMKESDQSPIEDKANFKTLNYFLPNEKYKVMADVVAYDGADIEDSVRLSDGSVEAYEKIGYAVFTIENQQFKLLMYRQNEQFSILFKDQTAPKETYGGGRYLDIPMENLKDQKLEIDFNLAYNPYCAYNHQYACPLPPKENELEIRIEAGEKN